MHPSRCNTGCNDSQSGHRHVATCKHKTARGQQDPYFAPFAEFEKAQAAIKKAKVGEYLRTLDGELRAAVRREMRQQLRELGI